MERIDSGLNFMPTIQQKGNLLERMEFGYKTLGESV